MYVGDLIFPFFQELNDIRSSGIKIFRNIEVDEQNILNWQGLIVPVSSQTYRLCYFAKGLL